MNHSSKFFGYFVVLLQFSGIYSEGFQCPSLGRFPNPASVDCRTFYVCTLNTENVLTGSVAKCPTTTIFNELDKQCVLPSTYTCPNSVLSTTTEAEASTELSSTERPDGFACPSQGRFPNTESVDCRTYYTCTLIDGNLVATRVNCPATTIFHWNTFQCVLPSSYTCPNAVASTTVSTTISTESSTESTTTELPQGFTCPSLGRFPNVESADCRTYYTCVTAGNDLVATLVSCPATTIFHWNTFQCVLPSSYTCPNAVASTTTSTTTPEPTTTTTASTTVSTQSSTESTTTELPQGFTCPSLGRFPNVESADCRTYYTCVTAGNDLVATLVSCPATTIFHWNTFQCVLPSSYTCPNAVASTTVPTTTPAPTTTTITPGQFTCNSPGRFPNPESSDCQTYKYCLQTAVSTFLIYTFRCPIGSSFSPEEARCSVGYVCQKESTTTTTEATPTAAVPFECDAEGRYPDPDSCSQYIFCSRNIAGDLQRYVFKCPPNSWFNPLESRCSASYSCV